MKEGNRWDWPDNRARVNLRAGRSIMNSTKITVTVENSVDPKQFTFEEPARCVVGRAEDCDIQFLPQPEHANVSRHHCVLDINPPMVTIRDLGSRNGTYVNG